jgi:hypothetical protein
MSTRGFTCSVARNAVLNTQELLEMIFTKLSIADLLTVRQVNHHFKAVINTSPKLQRKLFLAPIPVKYVWACDLKTAEIKPMPPTTLVTGQWRKDNNVFIPTTINPFIFKEKSNKQMGTFMSRAVYCEAFFFTARPDLRLLDERSLVGKMFVCNPPTDEVVLRFVYGDRPPAGSGMRVQYSRRLRVKIERKEGVRVKDVVEGFVKYADSAVGWGKSGEGWKLDLVKSFVWVKKMIFASEEERAMIEGGSFVPSEKEVVELRKHVKAVT